MLLLTSLSALQARQKTSLPASAYNLITYLAYVYYPPLYIAGPICTFNSFASQLRVPMRLQHKYVSFPVQQMSQMQITRLLSQAVALLKASLHAAPCFPAELFEAVCQAALASVM